MADLPRTITEAHEGLMNHHYTALELLERFQERIKTEEPRLHAFLSLTPELARLQAIQTDEKLAQGKPIGALEGIPCAIKDNILVEGELCTAASKMLEDYRAAYDATVIEKLKKSGAVVLGKTNLDEFAMGSSTEYSAFGPTKNPHDEERVPGGSSGGSAAAVAGEEALFALGSDTGGSVRQPAGFCGVVGLKPTYGSVSRYGLIAMVSSLDVIGPIANTVGDAEAVYRAIRGKDPLDATSSSKLLEVEPPTISVAADSGSLQGIRIGLPKEYFIEGMEPEVERAVRGAARAYQELGAEVKEVSLPYSPYSLPTYYVLVPAEVSANLARYDGIRYGKIRNPKSEIRNLLEEYLENRALLGAETKRRIMLGTFVLSHGYYDAYYKKALTMRALIKRDFEEVFKNVDVMFTPTSPTLPFAFGAKTADPLQMYLEDIFTVPVNLAGVPALSMNCGWAERGGKKLPIGMQLIAPWFGENTLFALGKAFERMGV